MKYFDLWRFVQNHDRCKTYAVFIILPKIFSILPKMSGYVKTSKDENNKLISLLIDDDKLLEKYKTIWTKTEDIKNIESSALPIYDDRYIKTKIRTYGNEVYTDFHGLNVPDDGVECESFTIISIDSLVVYKEKYYRQVYLDCYAYKIVETQ